MFIRQCYRRKNGKRHAQRYSIVKEQVLLLISRCSMLVKDNNQDQREKTIVPPYMA